MPPRRDCSCKKRVDAPSRICCAGTFERRTYEVAQSAHAVSDLRFSTANLQPIASNSMAFTCHLNSSQPFYLGGCIAHPSIKTPCTAALAYVTPVGSQTVDVHPPHRASFWRMYLHSPPIRFTLCYRSTLLCSTIRPEPSSSMFDRLPSNRSTAASLALIRLFDWGSPNRVPLLPTLALVATAFCRRRAQEVRAEPCYPVFGVTHQHPPPPPTLSCTPPFQHQQQRHLKLWHPNNLAHVMTFHQTVLSRPLSWL